MADPAISEPESSMKPEKKKSSPKPTPSKSRASSPTVKTSMAGVRARRTTQAGSTTTAVKARAARKPLKLPPILLEGDAPAVPPVSGPGQRYALGPTPPPEHSGGSMEPGELPEAYGTEKLLLTARDPYWLYAHWDLTRDQLRKYNALSTDRHLVLQIYIDGIDGIPFVEVHVHPESRNWFVHVGRAGTRFVAELGYYAKTTRRWVKIATSSPTLTPPDTLSPDTTVQFATIPFDIPFEQLLALVRTAIRDNVPLAEAILQLRSEGYDKLPGASELTAPRWTAEQERALAALVSMDHVRRVWIGSLEITELIRRKFMEEISSAGAALFSVPTSPMGAVSSLSSPFGGPERKKGFWFNVNAELIIYGATEPGATVTIGGRTIRLRPDGTFSYRFSLPDGEYELPAVATSADGDDQRSAALKFSRATKYAGDVGRHPQDARLKPPRVENVA